MIASHLHEYLCPKCNHINVIDESAIRDMYREQLTQCGKCGSTLEIIPADGIGEQINLVVSLSGEDAPLR